VWRFRDEVERKRGSAERRGPAQAGSELPARADPELAEDLARVPLDRARAEEQLRADLRIRVAAGRQQCDLALPRRRRRPNARADGGSASSWRSIEPSTSIAGRRATAIASGTGPGSRLGCRTSATSGPPPIPGRLPLDQGPRSAAHRDSEGQRGTRPGPWRVVRPGTSTGATGALRRDALQGNPELHLKERRP